VPTYQYRCTECGADLEAVQSFSDDPLTSCPTCGGTLRKVFSAVGVVFKGSGFYRTDSRKAPASTSAGGSGESKAEARSDSAKGDSTKGDSSKGDSSAKPAPATPSTSTSSGGESSSKTKPKDTGSSGAARTPAA
jgi:putative FmdB family regulatory protein